MLNSELKNLDRGRRKLPLKLKLSVLICLASLVNLSGAQNDNSQINFNLNKILYPYVNVSAPKELKIADSKASENETDYCFKPQCIQTASRVLKYMDTSSDPCDNFYKFACGQFIQSQIITGQSFELRNHFKTLHSEMVQKMKNILKQELKPTEPKYVKLMKTFYQNCINTETISDNEISKLVLDSITKIDGWRYLKNNSWEDMSFQWEDFDSKLQKELKLYETPFLSLELALDPKNNSKFFLKIKKPSKLEELTKNFNKFKNIFDELSEYDISLETVFNGIDKIKELLMNISIPENYEKLEPFKRMTVKELEKKYSNILWKKIINTNLHPFTEVRDDDIVLISDTTFFKKFNELINGVSKNDQAIYLMWGAIANILSSNDEIRKRLNNKEVCFIDLTNFFRNSFGALYVKNYYNETANNKHIEEMFTNIFHEFQTIIKNVDWLDNKTKDNALEKLSSMYESRQILYKISTDKEIDEYYANLEITSGHYFESMLNVIKFIRHSMISVFRLPVNRSHIIFRRNSADPVATNVFRFNTVGISQGMLQGDFFNANRPMYMNYGSTAFTIAHEFAHGFDNIGRQYDKNGYLVDWLQATSNEQFISRDRCFISQYDNYTDEEFPGEEVLRVNGTRTLGDNIADNGGLKLAYLAYQKWVEDHGPELLLPEINYTQSQLFWISYAQSFCEKATYFAKWQIYHNDVHSPKEFRVIGSILNRPEFARDFQCPKGSKMNPETKCSIW